MAFGAKIKLSVNNTGAAAFRREIQKYVDSATAKDPILIRNVSFKMTNAQKKAMLSELQEYLNNDKTMTLKISKIDASGAVVDLRKQLEAMLSGLKISGLKEFVGASNMEQAAAGVKSASDAAAEWSAQLKVVEDIQNRLASTYKTALSGKNMIADVSQITAITAAYTAWEQRVKSLKDTRTALSQEEIAALQSEGIELQRKITNLQEEAAAEKKTAAEAEKAAAQKEAADRRAATASQQAVQLEGQIQRYIISNSRAYAAYKNEIDALFVTLREGGEVSQETLTRVRTEFANIRAAATQTGQAGSTFFDTFTKGLQKFGGWSLVTRSMMAAYRTIRDMISAVHDLDDAMTELKKVTDLTEQAYANYLKSATQMAQDVGATLADTVNATADFARLGYDIADASSLAEAALVYKNVGDGIRDIGDASESIISTIKAFEQFGVTAEHSMEIVDKFNEVGNNFAISSEGIGTALRKSASALAAAGNSLEESIALVTGMNAVIQNPEQVGRVMPNSTVMY